MAGKGTWTVERITRHRGVAGQYSLEVTARYTDDDYYSSEYGTDEVSSTTFVGSTYGGPIVMVLPSGAQTFVSRDVTDRIGSKLDDAWVRRFFE